MQVEIVTGGWRPPNEVVRLEVCLDIKEARDGREAIQA